jgi:hypothetical protein
MQADTSQNFFFNNVVILNNANNVVLRSLEIRALSTTNVYGMSGIQVNESYGLTLEDCSIQLISTSAVAAPDGPSVGLLLLGDCHDLVVRRCSFNSSLKPTFTPVSSPASGAATRVEPAVGAVFAGLRSRVAISGAQQQAAVARTMVVTFGCIAVTLDSVGNPSPCPLGNCLFEGNEFDGLTFALAARVSLETGRVVGNRVMGCLAGIWIEIAGYVPPSWPPLSPSFQSEANAILSWEEASIGGSIVNPDPTFGSPPGDTFSPSSPSSLFVTDNQIEAIPAVGPGSSTALMILANTPLVSVSGLDTSVSLLIAGNRLRNRSPFVPSVSVGNLVFPGSPGAPTSLLVVADESRCVVSGNLVLNEKAGSSTNGPSLEVFPNGTAVGPNGSLALNLLTVTGNVLLGSSSTLRQLTRPDLSGTTWLPYNSYQPVN